MPRRITTEEFIKRAHMVHGSSYVYHKTHYQSATSPVTIECRLHGEFSQSPSWHLSGGRCPYCSGKLMNTASFKERANQVHGDRYDYSDVVYVRQTVNVIIRCPKHGSFQQRPSNHLMGSGCPACASESKVTDLADFKAKASVRHDGRYSYDLVTFTSSLAEKGQILCHKHGAFTQRLESHLRGRGCPICHSEARAKTSDAFVADAKGVHGDRYDYSAINYLNGDFAVQIQCPIHGEFSQRPHNHLQGSGCPKCAASASSMEQGICELLQSLGIPFEHHDRSALLGQEIDIFIPSRQIGIECDGLYWHSERYRGKDYHIKKTEAALSAGVRLVHVFEDEFTHKREIVLSRLRSILGCYDNRVGARECTLVEVDPSESRAFLGANHLQGADSAQVRLGLQDRNGKLVALMTFCYPRVALGRRDSPDGEWELSRFCTAVNTSVSGGANKLLRRFEQLYQPIRLFSYADRRWSTGDLYNTLGFHHVRNTKANYWYVRGTRRLHRFGFRKQELPKRLIAFDPDKTEKENMRDSGYETIYDCGSMFFEKKYLWTQSST